MRQIYRETLDVEVVTVEANDYLTLIVSERRLNGITIVIIFRNHHLTLEEIDISSKVRGRCHRIDDDGLAGIQDNICPIAIEIEFRFRITILKDVSGFLCQRLSLGIVGEHDIVDGFAIVGT